MQALLKHYRVLYGKMSNFHGSEASILYISCCPIFTYSTYPKSTNVWISHHVQCIHYMCVFREVFKEKRNVHTMRHICACIDYSPNVRLLLLQQPEEQEGPTVS